jgi:hypothetical protein
VLTLVYTYGVSSSKELVISCPRSMVWPSQVHDPSHAPWVSDCHFGHQGNTLGNACQSEMFIAGYKSVETECQLYAVQVEELQRTPPS